MAPVGGYGGCRAGFSFLFLKRNNTDKEGGGFDKGPRDHLPRRVKGVPRNQRKAVGEQS